MVKNDEIRKNKVVEMGKIIFIFKTYYFEDSLVKRLSIR